MTAPKRPVNASRNHKVGDYQRDADDWYVEPRWCVEQLASAIDFAGQTIWDPCCGGGTIPDVFRDRGMDTFATDIVDRGYAHFDALHDATHADFVGDHLSVVTNPPFRAAEVIVRAMLAVVDYHVCILQQLSFLASKGRHALFTEYPPSEILILSRRPSMPPGHLLAELGDKAFKGGTQDFCWIVWTRGHVGQTRTRWLNPETAA